MTLDTETKQEVFDRLLRAFADAESSFSTPVEKVKYWRECYESAGDDFEFIYHTGIIQNDISAAKIENILCDG